MESKMSSMSGLLDLENIKNTVTEETSYANLDAFVVNNMENDTTLKKTCTHTYILTLLFPKFAGSKKLHFVRSHSSKKRIFDLVKSFILDIRISVLLGKTISDNFGGTSASSKLLSIIKSSFTSKLSLTKAKKMVISEKILVNIDVISIRMQLIRLWQKALVEFESIDMASLVASKWLVLVDKDSVCVVLVLNDKESWLIRDHYWALLYTLPVGTTAYDLLDLVNSYSEKTCFIGYNPDSYVRDRCVVVCFNNKASKLAAISSILVYKGVNLCWAGLSLACCVKCKKFGHISDVCSIGGNSGVYLANIYKKKQALVARPVSFGGKSWAQVADGSLFCVFLLVLSSTGSLLSAKLLVIASNPIDDSSLAKCLASLDLVNLVPMSSLLCAFPFFVAPLLDSVLNSDMTVDNVVVSSFFSLLLVDKAVPELNLSSSKMLTIKVGGLELKMLALKVSVSLVLERLDSLCSGLGLLAFFPSQ
ncbi:hypothetical protein G9A89_010484 [Geosiphon pyriformis]|nr:hypothetical protein G9A89_010484 [Geosiphon pyriformis]